MANVNAATLAEEIVAKIRALTNSRREFVEAITGLIVHLEVAQVSWREAVGEGREGDG